MSPQFNLTIEQDFQVVALSHAVPFMDADTLRSQIIQLTRMIMVHKQVLSLLAQNREPKLEISLEGEFELKAVAVTIAPLDRKSLEILLIESAREYFELHNESAVALKNYLFGLRQKMEANP